MGEELVGKKTMTAEDPRQKQHQASGQGASQATGQVSGQADGQGERKAVSGVFSLQEVRKVGTGTTTRKTIQKSFWYADEQPDGSVELQLLNSNYIPAGPKKNVPLDTFLSAYSPEPEFYVSNVFPKMKELNKTVARADRYRANNELFSAEMEYNNALKLDIENVKANFGLGITYMERGETDKADNILERLVKLDAAFDGEHKHLFNDFGINLRKSGMLKQAVEYYKRALELSEKDENLHYNLARAYLELKQIESCVSTLLIALKINPQHDVSTKFLMWMVQKKLIPDNQQQNVLQVLRAVQQAKTGTSPSGASPAGTNQAGTGEAGTSHGQAGQQAEESARAGSSEQAGGQASQAAGKTAGGQSEATPETPQKAAPAVAAPQKPVPANAPSPAPASEVKQNNPAKGLD